jgi:hypothetical protein
MRNEKGEAGPVLVIVSVVLGLVILVGGIFVIKWATADLRGRADVREKTLANGDYRIAQYDHFYDLCGSIQAAQDRYNNATEMLAADPGNERYLANRTATKNIFYTAVREYNADSSKVGTAAQFKASDLPYAIDPTEGAVTCAR